MTDLNKNAKDLEKWFFWFWINNIRISFLLIFLLIFAWVFALYEIPKESSPDIKFGIINIAVSYPWVNPVSMDSLITEKIETEIEDLDWIKSIDSSSSVWTSVVTVELETWVDTRDLLTDIKDKVDKINFPEDASDPAVVEISANSTLIYEALIYWDKDKFSDFDLYSKAKLLKSKLEWKNWISDIEIWWIDNLKFWSSSGWDSDYTIKVLLDKTKIEQLSLSISNIANIIKLNNKDTPIWNFKVGDLSYDFRFDWEFDNIDDLKNVVIRDNWYSKIKLSDIAEFELDYPWDDIRRFWSYNMSWYNYISVVFNKSSGANVFDASKSSKEALEKLLSTDSDFIWLDVIYSKDMSEAIIKDYNNLWNTAISTIVLVLITIMFFVWLREWIIASMLIPLSFMVTFIVLDFLGLSMNFLTNFSLVLTLWIAIDTVIVIIEWASEKMKLWFTRRTAIMIAIRDFRSPLISWTLTTLAAFLPLMFLPWVVWKFLSFIPITVFSTLLAALILSLTLSSPLFLKFMRSEKKYHKDIKTEKNLKDSDRIILEEDRKWKELISIDKLTLREKLLHDLGVVYEKILKKILESFTSRILFIFVPFILLIWSFIFLSPKIWFVLFPSTDEGVINIDISWETWVDEEYMFQYVDDIEKVLVWVEELKNYYLKVNGNSISVYIDLLDLKLRKEEWLSSVYVVEKELEQWLMFLRSIWLEVSVAALKWGPPTWSAVWVKIMADSAKKFDLLKEVSEDFEVYLKSIKGSKNVVSSSSESPWQFIFYFDREKLSNVWLNQNDILSELYFYTNWLDAWSIKSDLEDNEIRVSFKDFEETLTPENLSNIIIDTKIWEVRVGDFADFEFKKSVNAITREEWNIVISIWSEVEEWFLPTDLQPKLDEFAENYTYPEWISFIKSWESEENMDLIVSTIKSLFITIFLIFSILVFQFNSFKQPIMVLYSIILALLWVNIWLYLTWNPYSMPFGIWFIALTWIVVNDAIILIDKINRLIRHKNEHHISHIDYVEQIVVAWKSRLQPIIVTTLTTVFWVLPLALQDEFWAWLWFTIIFGLFVWSFMTLIVTPVLYYSLVIKKSEKNKKDLS